MNLMHDIAFYRSRWHGLPVENEGRAFEAFDACTQTQTKDIIWNIRAKKNMHR